MIDGVCIGIGDVYRVNPVGGTCAYRAEREVLLP